MKRMFEVHTQLAKGRKPGMGALDNPSVLTEPIVLLDTSASNPSHDAQLVQMLAITREIVSLVSVQLVRTVSGAATESGNTRDRVDEGFEHHRVVPIRASDRQRQRHTSPIYGEMALAAELASIPIDLVMLAQSLEQGQTQSLPDALGLPVPQATPACHATTEAHLLRQVFPWDAGVQYKQDAV